MMTKLPPRRAAYSRPARRARHCDGRCCRPTALVLHVELTGRGFPKASARTAARSCCRPTSERFTSPTARRARVSGGNCAPIRIRDDGTLDHPILLHAFGSDHRGQHRGIEGMCLDADGNIVAVGGWHRSGPGPLVYVFAPSGAVTRAIRFRRTCPTNAVSAVPPLIRFTSRPAAASSIVP